MPRTGIPIFGTLPKLQKFVDGFEILHNQVLSCHLLNKIGIFRSLFEFHALFFQKNS